MGLTESIAELAPEARERANALSVAGQIMAQANRSPLAGSSVSAADIFYLAEYILTGSQHLERDEFSDEDLAELRARLTGEDLDDDRSPEAMQADAEYLDSLPDDLQRFEAVTSRLNKDSQ